MKRCAYCGRESPDEALACRECGHTDYGDDRENIDCGKSATKCANCETRTDIPESFYQIQPHFKKGAHLLCPACKEINKAHIFCWHLFLKLSPSLVGLLILIFFPATGLGCLVINAGLFQAAHLLSIAPHEFAHAITAKLLGFRVFAVHLGSGEEFREFNVLGFPTVLHVHPAGGLVSTAPNVKAHYIWKYSLVLLAGPAANIALSFFFLWLSNWNWREFTRMAEHLCPLQMFAAANLTVFARSIWPSKSAYGEETHYSDGLATLVTLKSHAAQFNLHHASRYVNECQLLMNNNSFTEANQWLDQAEALYPHQWEIFYYRGLCKIYTNQHPEAQRCFAIALGLGKEVPNLRPAILNNIAYSIALAPTADGLSEAASFSQEALLDSPKRSYFIGTRGAVLIALGKPEEGRVLLRQAMQTHDTPNAKAQIACWLAMAEAQLGDLEMGRKYLAEARKLDPTCCLLARTEQKLGAIAATVPSLTSPVSPANS